jgi:hypothetical protein
MLNPWLAFSLQAARLWETQNVMAFQLMRLAGGGAAGQSEAHRIGAEKAAALDVEKAAALNKVPTPRTAVAVKGGNGRGAAKKVTRVAKKRIRGNKRRVSK